MTNCYVGIKSCGCVVAAVVDRGDSNDTATAVAQFIRGGLRVESWPVERARAELSRCVHSAPSTSEQMTLL